MEHSKETPTWQQVAEHFLLTLCDSIGGDRSLRQRLRPRSPGVGFAHHLPSTHPATPGYRLPTPSSRAARHHPAARGLAPVACRIQGSNLGSGSRAIEFSVDQSISHSPLAARDHRQVVTSVGTLKTTYAVPASMWSGVRACQRKLRCLVVRFDP